MEKKQLPQICEKTGISWDYINEYSALYLDCLRNKELFFETLKENLPRYYEEVYNPNCFDIDLSNPRILLINQIADYIREKTETNSLTRKMFLSICDSITELIRD